MHKFSELLDDYLELALNPHKDSDWASIDVNAAAHDRHASLMQELRDAMDAMIGESHDNA